jgi:hypothetical protein
MQRRDCSAHARLSRTHERSCLVSRNLEQLRRQSLPRSPRHGDDAGCLTGSKMKKSLIASADSVLKAFGPNSGLTRTGNSNCLWNKSRDGDRRSRLYGCGSVIKLFRVVQSAPPHTRASAIGAGEGPETQAREQS